MLGTRYRPQTFAQVIGQERIVQTLQNALQSEKTATGYLFVGVRGTGKTTLARLLAKTLNCQSKALEPCNECASCVEIRAGHSLDVIEMDGASNRGIDDIRTITETAGYASSGRFKIYIIDEVHMLTKEAFNALLKTLEEPPSHVKFFFATTEPQKIPQTILSRVQRFDLRRLSEEEIAKHLLSVASLESAQLDEQAASQIANLAEGSLRDSLSLLDQVIAFSGPHPITPSKVEGALGLTPLSDLFALDQAAAANNLPFAFQLAQSVFESGRDLSYFFEQLVTHFRTLTLFKVCKALPQVSAKEYEASGALYSTDQLLYLLDYLIHRLESINKNPLKRFELEALLLHIIRSHHRIPLDAIAKQLLEPRKEIPSSPLAPPKPEAKVAPEPKPVAPPPSKERPAADPVGDTLIRFASVELNGVVK